MIDLDEGEVIIAPRAKNGRDTYHTDPSCDKVGRMDGEPKIIKYEYAQDMKECSFCSGEYEPHRGDEKCVDMVTKLRREGKL